MRQTQGHEFADLSLRRGHILTQHDRGSNLFAEHCVTRGKCDCLGDRGMRQQHLVHFERRDFLAPSVYHFLEAAEDREVSLFVQSAFVAGAKPTIDECRGIRRCIPNVAQGDVRTHDGDFAAHTRGNRSSVRIEHRY